jgi:hypothetical protein
MFFPNWYAVVTALFGVAVSYNLCDWLLKKVPRYNLIKPTRQRYIVKNLVKGTYLLILTLYALPYGYDAIFNGLWPNGKMQTITFLYAMPDLVGLIRVRSLHWMTKVHHSLVLCLTASSVFVDFTHTYWQWYLTYGLLSMFAWPVNFFLGAWRLAPSEHYRRLGGTTALMNYISCLATNWAWQIWHTFQWAPLASTRWDYTSLMFGSLILFLIAADDILLVQSLINHIRTKKMLKKYK